MKKSLWMKVLAVAAVLLLTAASGEAANRPAGKAVPAPEKKADGQAAKAAELVDINTATQAQLMSLPGIGETTARRIIRNRPYVKKDQLKAKKILTEQEYDKIKDKIIARQAPKKK